MLGYQRGFFFVFSFHDYQLSINFHSVICLLHQEHRKEFGDEPQFRDTESVSLGSE